MNELDFINKLDALMLRTYKKESSRTYKEESSKFEFSHKDIKELLKLGLSVPYLDIENLKWEIENLKKETARISMKLKGKMN